MNTQTTNLNRERLDEVIALAVTAGGTVNELIPAPGAPERTCTLYIFLFGGKVFRARILKARVGDMLILSGVTRWSDRIMAMKDTTEKGLREALTDAGGTANETLEDLVRTGKVAREVHPPANGRPGWSQYSTHPNN